MYILLFLVNMGLILNCIPNKILPKNIGCVQKWLRNLVKTASREDDAFILILNVEC